MDKLIKENKFLTIIIGLIIVLWIVIVVNDIRILFFEKRIGPGQEYFVRDYGNLGDNNETYLVCKYFNGRKIITTVFYYSVNNILGKDSCPFIDKLEP